MKLYMTESRLGDYCVLYCAKPRWDGEMWIGDPLFRWAKKTFSETFGFNKKLPTGKQVLVVNLTLK